MAQRIMITLSDEHYTKLTEEADKKYDKPASLAGRMVCTCLDWGVPDEPPDEYVFGRRLAEELRVACQVTQIGIRTIAKEWLASVKKEMGLADDEKLG